MNLSDFARFREMCDKDFAIIELAWHSYYDLGKKIPRGVTILPIEGERIEFEEMKCFDLIIPTKLQKTKIVTKDTQGGKSPFIISCARHHVEKLGISVIVVVQNSIDALLQLESRMISSAFVIDIQRGRDVSLSQVWEAMTTKPKIFLVKRNIADLTSLFIKISSLPLRRFIVIIDEADTVARQPNRNIARCLEILGFLTSLSRVNWLITATPLSLLFREGVHTEDCLILTPDENYKGTNEINFVRITGSRYSTRVGDDLFENDPGLEAHLRWLSQREPFPTNPIFCLYKLSRTKHPQHRAAAEVSKKYPLFTVITYNEEITLRGHGTPEESILNSNIVDGVHTFRGVELCLIINYLESLSNVTHLLVFSGVKADRAISFRGNIFTDDHEPWHLTDARILFSPNATQEEVIQTIGRLNGIWKDRYPRVVYTNDVESSMKTYNLSAELLERTLRLPVSTAESIGQHPMSVDKLASRPFIDRLRGKRSIMKKITVIDDDSGSGGYDWESERRIAPLIDEISISPVTRVKASKEEIKISREERAERRERNEIEVRLRLEQGDEEKEGLKYVVRAYKSKHGLIYQTIKYFESVEFRSCTIEELQASCLGRDGRKTWSVANYDHWDLSKHKRYRIIEKTRTGSYNLTAEVIDILGLI